MSQLCLIIVVRIVVFDSGLGSLSIIKEIQSLFKSEIIYFADNQNYPYGRKSKEQLKKIIDDSINLLEKQFSPDFIVVASNTPSLMLNLGKKIIDVKPPLKHAEKISKSKSIGILATTSAINSKGLQNYINEQTFQKSTRIFKLDGSELVDLVESGKFLFNKQFCNKTIKKNLDKHLSKKFIDTVTLSSTHLPFIRKLLELQYPNVNFIDPGKIVAKKIYSKIKYNKSKRNSLKIFTSGNVQIFENKLKKIGIKNKVNYLSI